MNIYNIYQLYNVFFSVKTITSVFLKKISQCGNCYCNSSILRYLRVPTLCGNLVGTMWEPRFSGSHRVPTAVGTLKHRIVRWLGVKNAGSHHFGKHHSCTEFTARIRDHFAQFLAYKGYVFMWELWEPLYNFIF